ncbi:acyltransferase family protein [Oryzihumus leptocrescens]|uniref:Peptidoglycan/LPS O-acetylase OafA/YrhL n=1 Tax=Oryzihumus leptocrescens TaxID=297536 RepID=A0A542ZGE7_9MICO|nr:acyltransferase family protein [Oryzihumus leptocrescens]TQL59369.1 peptidoglycan/LPS O-acetylase OafA/YrhL [Oryzihumus leptocrescens]
MSAQTVPPNAPDRRHFLPEVQALRAVAVALVVLFHLWPSGVFSGGFVGVDAFFVISGYLITSHLLRELDATGTVRLAAFYARRARRLLPAAVVVLLACTGASVLLLPSDLWSGTAQEVAASGFYVQNLWLASKAVTYSASNDVASPVQHFWSLSAEEQFYLLWPSLILASCWIGRRWLRGRTTRTVGAALVLLTMASFAFSCWETAAHPAAAYFITPTRAWEFGVGALLVLVLRRAVLPMGLRVALRWGGIAAVFFCAVTYSQATPFPGWRAALPVLATAAVITAGDTGRRDPLGRAFGLRPVQWLGDVSYSVYLWHWPLIVFWPYVAGHDLTLIDRLLLIAVCLVISAFSKRYVEDLTRLWPRLRHSPRRTLAAALGVMLAIGAATAGQAYAANVQENAAIANLADSRSNPCFGARALAHRDRCPDAFTAAPLTPVSKADAPWAPVKGCAGLPQVPGALSCYWGKGRPSRVVALVGDSHAEHWRAALHLIAREKNWRVVEMFAGGCPATYAHSVEFERRSRDGNVCSDWTRRTTQQLRALAPDEIVTSAYVKPNKFSPPGSGPAGFEAVWREWRQFSQVAVVRDIPGTNGRNGPQCLAVHAGDPLACSSPRRVVLEDDDMMRAARAMRSDGIRVVDLSDKFCDPRTCYAVVGKAPVYYDYDHMTNQFSASLAPFLAAGLT